MDQNIIITTSVDGVGLQVATLGGARVEIRMVQEHGDHFAFPSLNADEARGLAALLIGAAAAVDPAGHEQIIANLNDFVAGMVLLGDLQPDARCQ